MSFTNAENVVAFCLSGNATITIQSHRTEMHYTFRIERAKKGTGNRFFVNLLTGPEQYSYLGMISADRSFRVTRGSKFSPDSKPAISFNWFWRHMTIRSAIPELLEIRHDGKCGRCGRQLTTPTSIDRGIGPECYKKEISRRPSATAKFPCEASASPMWLG